jgi:GMP synthase-like glutamine amidotransferase
MATCLEIRHGPAEQAYAVGDALRDAGVDIVICDVAAGDGVPRSAAAFDGLLVMGGAMSAASDGGFPTRRAEVALLGDAVARGVPTLGICLGAQLLAAAGGGAVYPGPAGLEIGWVPVRVTAEGRADHLFSTLPSPATVLGWHGDTFDLPSGATHLARGDAYSNQAFRLGTRAWGVQFHIEVDAGAMDAFLADFADEAATIPGGAGSLRSPAALAELARARAAPLARFAALVTGAA